MQEWRPIKTAPKDGSKILLSCPPKDGYGGLVEKCYWHKYDNGRGKWWNWFTVDKPTHWMPLPTPPKG